MRAMDNRERDQYEQRDERTNARDRPHDDAAHETSDPCRHTECGSGTLLIGQRERRRHDRRRCEQLRFHRSGKANARPEKIFGTHELPQIGRHVDAPKEGDPEKCECDRPHLPKELQRQILNGGPRKIQDDGESDEPRIEREQCDDEQCRRDGGRTAQRNIRIVRSRKKEPGDIHRRTVGATLGRKDSSRRVPRAIAKVGADRIGDSQVVAFVAVDNLIGCATIDGEHEQQPHEDENTGD